LKLKRKETITIGPNSAKKVLDRISGLPDFKTENLEGNINEGARGPGIFSSPQALAWGNGFSA